MMTAEMAVAALGARAVLLLVAADQVSAGEVWIGGFCWERSAGGGPARSMRVIIIT